MPPSAPSIRAVKSALRDARHRRESFSDHLLFEPWEVKTKAAEPFKVFTPFWRACARVASRRRRCPRRSASRQPTLPAAPKPSRSTRWICCPPSPIGPAACARPGRRARPAHASALTHFLDKRPARLRRPTATAPIVAATSRLSPHLRFGEISPRQVWHARARAADDGQAPQATCEKFLARLGWREFSYHLLFHYPDLATAQLRSPRSTPSPGRTDAEALRAWQRGRTGYPIVDAGMRELWHTGWMHNRVRMIAASFLIKHLLIDWRDGRGWFWDTLVDADPANNAASWQWVAGCGADAAPYFRIFNPVLQGEKFDPEGLRAPLGAGTGETPASSTSTSPGTRQPQC